MKKSLLSLGLILFFLVPFPVQAQDPGIPDTVYFKAGTPCSANGDTLYVTPDGKVYIRVWVWSDDSIKVSVIPLTNTAFGPPGNAYLDSLDNGTVSMTYPPAFNGSVAHCPMWIVNVSDYPPDFLLSQYVGFGAQDYYGEGLYATLTFGVSDTCTICLDTTFFPPSHHFLFANFEVTGGWAPQFLSRCFSVRYGGRELLQVFAPEVDTGIVGETLSFEVEVNDPLGDPLVDDALVLYRKISTGRTYYATNYINRISGHGTSEGVWEMIFPIGITGEFDFEMKFSGVNGAAGFDTTKVFLFFERGDVNDDGIISISDIVAMIDFLFRAGWPPPPKWAENGDCNCDLDKNVSDVIYLINYLFKNGPRPLCY